MLNISSLLDVRKEFIIGLTLSLAYIAYYLVEVVKVPLVVSGGAELGALVRSLPALRRRYWPAPWCLEARLQTVAASLLRSRLLPAPRFSRQLVPLRDGGTVALDWLDGQDALPADAPVLLLLPGLCGDASADYARVLADAARALNARLAVLTQRGLGGLSLTTPRLYCAVSHEDLAEAAAAARSARPGAPLLGVGVSLGGLILGQYLAAQGEGALFAAALAVSVPLDVPASAVGLSRAPDSLLSRHLAGTLRRTLATHDAALRPVCDWGAVDRCRSVREFDEAFTAPHFGFASADEYYAAASLHDKLQSVRVPLLCLQAADDPFQPLRVLPLAQAGAARCVALAVPARGGHIAFLEGWRPLRDHFLVRLTRDYFAALLARPDLLHCC